MEFSNVHMDLLDEALRGRIAFNDPRFLEWLEASERNRQRYEEEIAQLANEIHIGKELNTEILWKKIDEQVNDKRKKRFRLHVLKFVAVIVLPILVVFGYLFGRYVEEDKIPKMTHFISPGSKMATLTLSTGEQINLKETLTSLEEINGTQIGLQTEGKIVYVQQDQQQDEAIFNIIDVPVKGEYCITLVDGTQVWLASASKLKFPVNFVGDKREVYLEGEAFFEVSPNKEKPFIVLCSNFSVKALGTSFNVMSYPDETCAQATLNTGKVEVAMKAWKQTLNPGQQVVIQCDSVFVRDVNLIPYTSWMNDRFYFLNEELQVIMRKIARWYGAEIVYTSSEIKKYHFTGNIPKYSEIDKVFELLGLTTNVKFQIQGDTIMISDR